MHDKYFEIDGVTRTFTEWCDMYEVEKRSVDMCMKFRKVGIKEALEMQRAKQPKYTYDIIDTNTDEVIARDIKGKDGIARYLGITVTQVCNMESKSNAPYMFVAKDNMTPVNPNKYPPDIMARWDKARKKLNPNAK